MYIELQGLKTPVYYRITRTKSYNIYIGLKGQKSPNTIHGITRTK